MIRASRRDCREVYQRGVAQRVTFGDQLAARRIIRPPQSAGREQS
jgi:hypothetical protein